MNGETDTGKKLIVASDIVSHFDDSETIKKAIHEEIEIKSFYAGASTLLIGSETVRVKAGDVVVINPYEFHTTIDTGIETGRYHTIMVPLDYFSDTAEQGIGLREFYFSGKKAFRTLFADDAELTGLVKRIADECKTRDRLYEFAVRGLMMQLFCVLIRRGILHGGDCTVDRRLLADCELIEPAIRYIRDRFADDVEVEHLAALCSVSKYYFCHRFKAVTGLPAMGYVRQYRLKIADVMLMSSAKNVEDIAEQCGFESANYFIRSYKRHYGVTPGKRRAQIRKTPQ